MVEVDPVFGHPELAQPFPLCGEVLGVGGAESVADPGAGHDQSVTGSHPALRNKSYHLCEMPLVKVAVHQHVLLIMSGWGSLVNVPARGRRHDCFVAEGVASARVSETW